jgi:hypothetical protein
MPNKAELFLSAVYDIVLVRCSTLGGGQRIQCPALWGLKSCEKSG